MIFTSYRNLLPIYQGAEDELIFYILKQANKRQPVYDGITHDFGSL